MASGILLIAAVLAIISATLSLLLLLESLRQGRLPGCGPSSGCGAVARSRWARIGRLPVAAVGVITYCGVAILSWISYASGSIPLSRILIVLAFAAAGAAVWFSAVQFFLLRRFCPYCTLTHSFALIIAGLVTYQAHHHGHPVAWMPLILTAGAMLTLFIIVQVFVPSAAYAVTHPDAPAAPAPPTPAAACASAAAQPLPEVQPRRRVTLAGGAVRLDITDWPVFGARDAAAIIAVLIDYTCPDCRQLHRVLEQTLETLDPRPAVLLVPTPLEPACNPAVDQYDPVHAQACDYARLSLSVWLAAAKHFPVYHSWLLQGPRPPQLSDARARAQQLTQTASASAVVQRRLRLAAEIYRAAGADQLPKLLLPRAVVMGAPPIQELRHILIEELGRAHSVLRPEQAAEIPGN